ncbi:aspartate aminotransferase family protein [Granulosicoccus antarcticus]|uniref:Acetylornithine aminotransferase n=1 Tax=Granulosicoccus antarcticus IMCC3135 TaxID=1192854 RepID=A0A2Z2P1K4_9GAMM|nr:aspartate aminotransferase family protein [Granulosicoccus antarcticus]ASJ76421.1 Acetylornithine aminotransferase [Granulosicoccus antarcticus IMCC3135]
MASLMAAYGRLPVSMLRGEGARLWDDKGREYLDALSGIAVCSLGHANPVIAEAIASQARELMHVSNVYNIPQQEELGEQLCRVSGMDKAFFCNSGAEANEAAIKIARLHGHAKGIATPTIIVMDTAFHGRTLATISATGNQKIKAGFGPMLEGFEIVPFNDVAAIEVVASKRDDVVAIMVEPIQGEGGVNIPDEGYLKALRALCDQHDWLLICDEIQSGMGRTGTWFAHQHEGIQPDIMSVAKALGNGMPIGACLARGAAAELIQPGTHGTTFGGNPLACRVGLTVIQEMERLDLINRADELGKRMLDGFHSALHNQPGVRAIRGQGLMLGVELDVPCPELVRNGLDAGILFNVTAGNVIRLLPPFIITNEEADEIVRRICDLIIDFLQHADLPASSSAGSNA